MQASPRRITAHNPASWLLLLKWFITAPHHLKLYLDDLTADGHRELRQATTWIVTSLCFLPLLVLSAYAGAAPGLMARLADYAANQKDGTTLWVSQHWLVVPFALAICWVSAVLLDFRLANGRVGSAFAALVSGVGTLAAAMLS